MKIADFDFSLPKHLIAQTPSEKREHSRLLKVERHNHTIEHLHFFQLVDQLRPYDLLVMNDSRTMNARLSAHKQSGGKIEIFIEQILTKERGMRHAKAMLKCSRKPKVGDKLQLSATITAAITQRQGQWFWLQFNTPVLVVMQQLGQLPLPPYIKRPQGATPEDNKRYQTIYGEKLGSVATPTAGLHFSDELFTTLNKKNILQGFLTLHVGSGTFQPVRETIIEHHTMHKEFINIDEALCDKIRYCKKKNGRVIAVGTTSVRALESMMRQHQTIAPYHDYSDIFLYPGAKFSLVEGIVTNFHLPKSTLLMLVSAFAGSELIKKAYAEAIERSYRFFSYGDAMLIL